jgi:hypothetical protein
VLKKKINIPESNIEYKTSNGRKIAYGTYKANNKTYIATRIVKA